LLALFGILGAEVAESNFIRGLVQPHLGHGTTRRSVAAHVCHQGNQKSRGNAGVYSHLDRTGPHVHHIPCRQAVEPLDETANRRVDRTIYTRAHF
jgi:hypothetical protein